MQTTLKPLSGRRIMITRPTGEAKGFARKLRALGATTIEVPTIGITQPLRFEAVDNAVRDLKRYDWVIFTSVNGVRFFLDRMLKLKVATDVLDHLKVAAIGSVTGTALKGAVRKVDFIPEEYLSETIAVGIGDVRGKRILLPRGNAASKQLPLLLRERGATVDEVVVYETILPPELTPKTLEETLQSGIDLITFTSPSTVQNFLQVLNENTARGLKNIKVACIGPVTCAAASKLGIAVDIVARKHTVDALVEAIVNEIGNI